MFTLHVSSHWSSSVRSGLALCSVLLAMALAGQAQTQAACTFNFFSPTTPFKLHNGNPVYIEPLGINDFGTIVGYSIPGTSHRGLIRWANGGVTHVKGTSGLMARNDHGTSVGEDLTPQAILVNGTTLTPIVLDVNNVGFIEVNGINRWGTIVGEYFTLTTISCFTALFFTTVSGPRWTIRMSRIPNWLALPTLARSLD